MITICTYDPQLLPHKKTTGAVCRDLKIAKDIEVAPGELITVSTGIKTSLPQGRCGKMYARSSLPVKRGLMLANSVGIFDADYRGEYIAQFYNFSKETKHYKKYDRLAQLEFMPYYIGSEEYGTLEVPKLECIIDQKTFDNFENVYSTERGTGRFASTGLQ